MKPKTKRFSAPATEMRVGMQLLKIDSIRWARNTAGQQIANDDGEMALDIRFINQDGADLVHRFWMSEKAIYILINICKATGVYVENRQIPAKNLKGKTCYGIIAAQFYFEGNNVVRNPDGTVMYRKVLVPKFYPNLGDAPTKKGDPAINGGIPAEDFITTPLIDLNQFITDKDREWFYNEMGGCNSHHAMKNGQMSITAQPVSESKIIALNDEF